MGRSSFAEICMDNPAGEKLCSTNCLLVTNLGHMPHMEQKYLIFVQITKHELIGLSSIRLKVVLICPLFH